MTRRVLPLPALWALALVAYGLVIALRAGSGPEVLDPTLQIAVERHGLVQKALWEELERRVDPETLHEIARNDPRKSGFVGTEWGPLTTTAGSLDAKRATTSSAWILLFRRWYQELGLRPGDRIAINASGSFPALFHSARIAADSLGLQTHSVISLTASNYGATIPGFDFWEIEQAIQRTHLVPRSVIGITPGGYRDVAAGLDDPDRQRLRERFEELPGSGDGLESLWPESVEESRLFRQRLLLLKFSPSVYISIGGHTTGYGTGMAALAMPNGIIRPGDVSEGALPESLLGDAIKLGIPAINVLDIKGIMASEGLPPGGEFLLEPLSPTRRAIALLGSLLLIMAIFVYRPASPPLVPEEENFG